MVRPASSDSSSSPSRSGESPRVSSEAGLPSSRSPTVTVTTTSALGSDGTSSPGQGGLSQGDKLAIILGTIIPGLTLIVTALAYWCPASPVHRWRTESAQKRALQHGQHVDII